MIRRPQKGQAPEYSWQYINLLAEEDLLQAFEANTQMTLSLCAGIPESKGDYCYAEGKWSIKQLLEHIVDSERIFAYRALCFSRKDESVLPGYDEDLYAENSNHKERKLSDVLEEFKMVRAASVLLFKSFQEKQLDFVGKANDMPYSPRSLGWMIVGHCEHHARVLKERYLNAK